MEGHGQNIALFYQILRLPAPHRHLMGEYPVHLSALSGQVRVHIALQGDVGVSVSQQFAEGLYIFATLSSDEFKKTAAAKKNLCGCRSNWRLEAKKSPVVPGK